ncbi:12192_t:CDS:2 [Funneliformis mosseae]|uniref:12192_t:CDS:1 n=1 Tax=Funneliformis mosseae TaxID=27381 RepID=A0A9N9DEW7_FUNMO|nr:12192_t:CDS:2 [Funneliformis mosseae]
MIRKRWPCLFEKVPPTIFLLWKINDTGEDTSIDKQIEEYSLGKRQNEIGLPPYEIRNMGPVVDSNVMNITGEENTGRVDYAIKKILDDLLEEIICITEGKLNQATVGMYKHFSLQADRG